MTFSCNNITYMLQLILGKEDTNEITEIYYHNIVISFNYRYRNTCKCFCIIIRCNKTYLYTKINKKSKEKAVGASYNGKTIKTKAPGYKTENTPMLSAYYVFKKGMGVSYSYSKKIGKSL